MKRGNTALKRGVAIAAAFTTAIAGAVLAAPAASAAPVATTVSANSARAIPTADAAWMNADGSVRSTADTTAGTIYGLGASPADHATGVAPNLTIGKNGQAVTGLQVLLPTGVGNVPQWGAGDTLTVTLTGGSSTATPNVTLTGGATATLSAAPLADTADLTKLAGVSNAAAHQSGVATQSGAGVVGLANTSATAKKDTAAANVLNVSLPDPGTAHGNAASAYLLTITGLNVNVAAANSSSTSNVPVVAEIKGAATAGTTTVGYINAVNIATSGDSTSTSTNVSLPGIVLAEATAMSFGTSPVVVSVTGTANSGAGLNFGDTNQKVSGTSALSGLSATAVAGGFNIAFTEAATTSAQSLVATGLTVGNVKPGTDLTVTVTTPKSAAMNGSTASHVAPQSEGASVTVKPTTALPRIFGSSRYDTAAKIADLLKATNAVVLANGENGKLGVDALSANFLAGIKDAPILLTEAGSLPKATSDELTALFTNSTASITLYVMGKTDSVSQKVRDDAVTAIKAKAVTALASVTVVEVAGSDRYATSAATVDKAGASNIGAFNLGKGSRDTAFLASGQVNADALAAGAVSAGQEIPVLLTSNGKALPESVQKVITTDGITQIIILGNTDRVSKDVEDALTKAGVNVVRIAGSDRYDTAQQIASLALAAQPNGLGATNSGTIYLANGAGGWADALAVGPYAGLNDASLVTVSDGASLPGSTAVFLASNKTPTFTSVYALGGTDRVTDSALKQAIAILGLS